MLMTASFFLRATYKNACNLKSIQEIFCRWSGKRISDAKSTLFTSANIVKRFSRGMAVALKIQITNEPSKYLGVPLQWGRISINIFNELPDKLDNRMQGWKSKTLDMAGRTTLIRSVLDPVPNHVMSILKLPKGLLYQKNFVWGVMRCERPTFLNLLAKMAWRVFVNPNSQVSKLLKANYFADNDFWLCNANKRSSGGVFSKGEMLLKISLGGI